MNNKIKSEYNPLTISYPGSTLLDLLEEKNMSQKELSLRTGRPWKTINEIIHGKTSITPETAIQFERVLGVPASFWNNRQKRFDEYIASKNEKENLNKYIEWMKLFPINQMIKNGWLNKFSDKVKQLQELLNYFGISTPEEWNKIWLQPNVIYRQSIAFKRNVQSISVWLRQGEILSNKISCSIYNKTKFRNNLNQIRNLVKTTPDYFESKVVDLFSEAGVSLVFVPRLKGVPVYGITRWITQNKAIIQLTLRGKYEDMFWFTLFHEAGHLLLHGKRDIFIEETGKSSKKEFEADEFASNMLIPKNKWDTFILNTQYYSKVRVMNFAQKIDISPAIVVGRLQYENIIPKTHLNQLRRKYIFSEKTN